MYLRYCCAAAIATLGLGGCAQQPYNDDAAWPPPRPLGKELEVFRPPAKLSEMEPVEIPAPVWNACWVSAVLRRALSSKAAILK